MNGSHTPSCVRGTRTCGRSVSPNRRPVYPERSTMATLAPARASVIAAAHPAGPPPTTRMSNRSSTGPCPPCPGRLPAPSAWETGVSLPLHEDFLAPGAGRRHHDSQAADVLDQALVAGDPGSPIQGGLGGVRVRHHRVRPLRRPPDALALEEVCLPWHGHPRGYE